MKECFREPVQRVKGVKILKASSKVMTFSANFCAGSVYFVYIAQQRELLAHFAQHWQIRVQNEKSCQRVNKKVQKQ